MIATIDFWKYGDPQHELNTAHLDERTVYGAPQHDLTAPINVELRESISYLHSWEQYAQERRQDVESKPLIPTIGHHPSQE